MKKNNFVKTDKNCQYPTGEGWQCASKMTAQEWKKVCDIPDIVKEFETHFSCVLGAHFGELV